MGFSRQEYWSGSPYPSPRDIPDPGIEPASPALAGGFSTTEPLGKPKATVHGVAELDTTEQMCAHYSPHWPGASWSFSHLLVHSPNIHRAVTMCSGWRTSCEHHLPLPVPREGPVYREQALPFLSLCPCSPLPGCLSAVYSQGLLNVSVISCLCETVLCSTWEVMLGRYVVQRVPEGSVVLCGR